MMRFGYFGYPHVGGTYTVFRHLRMGLSDHGIDVRWIGVGPGAAKALADPRFSEATATGFVAGGAEENERRQAEALVRAVEDGGFDGVFVNALSNRVQTNAARYLPADTLRVLIVHNITPGTYGAARAVRDHVHAAVGVSERCRADLVAHYGFDPRRTLAIPNAVEIGAPGARPERRAGGLRLIFLGRVEDSSKGVMWLPSILKHLPADTALTVAGDGPDWARLADKLKPFGARVTMLGAVSPGRVRELMTSHDMFVMPSRFEGFGIALVEAMAGGCVPVASLIHGVTDTIVTDGTDGILVPVGDWRAAAREIEALWLYPERLAALSRAAMRRAEGAFPISAMAERYAALIADLAADPPVIAAPLPLETWALPRGLRDGFRTYLPGPVKNGLRVVKERLQGVRARSGRLTASSAE